MTFSTDDQRRVLLIDSDSRRQHLRTTALRSLEVEVHPASWDGPSPVQPLSRTECDQGEFSSHRAPWFWSLHSWLRPISLI